MASRISRAGDRGEDARWLWEREGDLPGSSIRHPTNRSDMLFSCSVSYRASAKEPLFRQFHGEVRRIPSMRSSQKAASRRLGEGAPPLWDWLSWSLNTPARARNGRRAVTYLRCTIGR